ncbi:branched-chain amino acid ABC transporter substrate-binding protein [Ralstonia solanacearum]|uniref:Leucine-specific binding transmembrane protein n=1 Tax=Ralstonia solanacearum (strain Po82) TaxID=1031711 RepID=F6G6A6_RALS8|nr:branched-chain amino acid ABC transporter substrate-binding protein [Ralstonia solanacearum]AEG67451.1 leucine-specific binding precursor transmembrane protein [Ralstonia solanacearum Po82]AMP68858.1 amino acid ABC transporter substrate-binding protein [Ralstonia solanacearum]AMP74237.1 amino acid ABC transporter substrate-binding protein [Ralstonia solanacearum]AYB59226.1 branched-chain amino acid ABC transporter substrate-binding protein [Ralstonia solanacearum]EUJ16439.1 amino acid ABC t
MKRKQLWVAAALCALAGGATTAASAQEVVKLGFAAPMTGAQAQYGKDMQNGVTLAIEEFNATKPKIAGKDVKFQLVSEDDQADPKTGTTVAQKLVDGGIKGMLGHFNSGTSIPASRVYNQAGIAQIAMATAPEYTKQGYKTTFRMMTSDTQQGSVVGTFAVKKLGYKNIAIVDDRTAYGQGLADEFEKAAKAAGATIVRREYTNDKASDFKAILTQIKSKSPDAVFYGGAEGQSAPLVKQMRELGMKSTLMSGEMSKTDDFIKLAGAPAAEGVVCSLAGLPLEQMPGGAGFRQRYEKRFGSTVQTYSPYAYDGAMALMKSMVAAGSSDPSKYLPILSATNTQGVTAKHYAYDDKGDLKDGGITVYKVTGGKWVPLESVGGK